MTIGQSNYFGFPEYCITTLKDDKKIDPAIVELNIEKRFVEYIKNLLELEGNPASVKDILFLTTGTFTKLEFSTRLSLNNIEEISAMKNALNLVLVNYKNPITSDIIELYNFTVVIGEKKRKAGRLRDTNVRISGTIYSPPSFDILPKIYKNMFDAIDCVEGYKNKALSYLLAISKNQFFIDGNKRTARLVALHVLANGMQKTLDHELDTQKYLEYLINFYETGNSSNMVKFFEDNLVTL